MLIENKKFTLSLLKISTENFKVDLVLYPSRLSPFTCSQRGMKNVVSTLIISSTATITTTAATFKALCTNWRKIFYI